MKLSEMDVPKAPCAANPWNGYELLRYVIKVVTPILGGGAVANKSEECFAVRPSEIRGHLRFWWREMFAKNLEGDILRSAEAAIWGDSKNASNVRVVVEGESFTEKRMKSNDYFGFRCNSKESYALFPLDSVEDPACSIIKEGGRFTCKIFIKSSLTEEQFNQVKSAVDAWIMFGGIGARSRRGLGSLQCDSVGSSIVNRFPVFIGSKNASAMDAWANGLNCYKNFRQLRRPGQGKNRRGRSFWPEAESCRGATGQRLSKHQSLGRCLDGTGAVDEKFTSPKAALGMPIIVHFKDNGPNQDPEDVMINVDGKEGRMGSPVIVKPIYKDGSWHSSFIFLCDSAKEALAYKIDGVGAFGKTVRTKPPVAVLRNGAIPAAALGVEETADAIIALQQYVEKNGYKKVGGDK